MAQSKELYDAILNGDAKKAHAVTQTALAVGALPMDLISESMVPAMDESAVCSRRKNTSFPSYCWQVAL